MNVPRYSLMAGSEKGQFHVIDSTLIGHGDAKVATFQADSGIDAWEKAKARMLELNGTPEVIIEPIKPVITTPTPGPKPVHKFMIAKSTKGYYKATHLINGERVWQSSELSDLVAAREALTEYKKSLKIAL